MSASSGRFQYLPTSFHHHSNSRAKQDAAQGRNGAFCSFLKYSPFHLSGNHSQSRYALGSGMPQRCHATINDTQSACLSKPKQCAQCFTLPQNIVQS